MIAPKLEKIAGENDLKLIIAKVDTDENPNWAVKYGGMGIPTLLFVKQGQVVDCLVGAAPAALIHSKVENLLKKQLTHSA